MYLAKVLNELRFNEFVLNEFAKTIEYFKNINNKIFLDLKIMQNRFY